MDHREMTSELISLKGCMQVKKQMGDMTWTAARVKAN